MSQNYIVLKKKIKIQQQSKRQTLQTDFIIPYTSMQHPEYKKPLQFRNVQSFIPQTPNLQEVKRKCMKAKGQKAQQAQLKIMTPRSTQNIVSDRQPKKSFRNLSLVLNCQEEGQIKGPQAKTPQSHDLKENELNYQNKMREHIGTTYEGKQNMEINQDNPNMKKKLQQNTTILFKQVKSTKSKPLIDKLKPNEQLNQKLSSTKLDQYNSQNQITEQYSPQSPSYLTTTVPYANNFASGTYQSHCKALMLTAFKQSLGQFTTHLQTVQSQLTYQLTNSQHFLQKSIHEINLQFQRVFVNLLQLRQNATKQITDFQMQMNSEYKEKVKQLNDIGKSILRYQVDIDLHYDDIVRELQFKCFENIMAQYDHKLEYFGQKVKWILEYKVDQPQIFHQVRKLQRYIEKIGFKYQQKFNEMEENYSRNLKNTNLCVSPKER